MSNFLAVNSRLFPQRDLMAWVVCLSAGLFFFYEFFQLTIFDVINQPLREEFNIDAAQLSWMSSSYLWANILFLIPAGIILDRYSARRVILMALSVCIIGTLGFALSQSFAASFFFHFLAGIGNAFCLLSCVVLISHWFPPRRQALVVGLVVTMAFIGGMMAHTPFAVLNEAYGWREALVIDGIVGIVILLWIYWVVLDRPTMEPESTKPSMKQVLVSFKKALSNKQNWLAGLYTSFLNLPIMVLCALWGASYLQTAHHLSDSVASNVVSMILMGSIVGCPLVGWLSDKQGLRKPLMIIGAIATLLCVMPLFLPITLSLNALTILFFALGFFTSTQVISYPLVAESNPLEYTGAATGIASVLIMGGGAVGQIAFGWLMANHASPGMDDYAAVDFQAAMWLFPLTTIAAIIAVLLTRETYCKRH